MPTLSIVIPCYNSGNYLLEAISSVRNYNGNKSFEIIIVNDGSFDIHTLRLLDQLKQQDIKLIEQENAGPAAARNKGVRIANSEFILFLDADNKIRANTFIDKAVNFLQQHAEVAVFYGDVNFFGDVTNLRSFKSRPFDFQALLGQNYIDMCSLVRKQALNDVHGLDENRFIIGHEDWDLWLRIAKHGWKLHYHNEVLFDYRIRKNSLIEQTMNSKSHNEILAYILSKHVDVLPNYYINLSQNYDSLKRYYNSNLLKRTKINIKHFLNKIGLTKFPKKEKWI